MATKEFTPEQVIILTTALTMYCNSMDRRANTETDQDSKNVWLGKKDKANIISSKLRLTEPTK